MKHLQLMKLLFVLFLVLFMYQCEDAINDPALNDSESVSLLKPINGNGGNNGGGGNNGNIDYGELVVCLRNSDGVASYVEFPLEHDPWFLIPIKFTEDTEIPSINEDTGEYETFELNEVGEVIEEEGFIVKEADFGRLSLVRAPQAVLDAALDEAIVGLTQAGVTNITTDASGRLVAIIGAADWTVNYDDDPDNDEENDKTIDSPRENMAIYQELMSHGFDGALGCIRSVDNVLDLAIGALAAGADKTGNINVDEIAYMNDWIIDWTIVSPVDIDDKGRNYFNFQSFVYDRESIYGDKCVKITTNQPNDTNH